MRSHLLLAAALVAVGLIPGSGLAATPVGGTVSPTVSTTSWTGGPFLTSNPSGVCLGVDPACDCYSLTVVPPATGSYTVEIAISPRAKVMTTTSR